MLTSFLEDENEEEHENDGAVVLCRPTPPFGHPSEGGIKRSGLDPSYPNLQPVR